MNNNTISENGEIACSATMRVGNEGTDHLPIASFITLRYHL